MDSDPLLYGPILFGGAVALILSGVVAVQCIIFFKLYPDEAQIKLAMVGDFSPHLPLAMRRILDIVQTTFIIISLFHYFIVHFGNPTVLFSIPWCLTILVTAMQTCVVHLFYAQKIYRSSGKNWWITAPIVLATAEMLRIGLWAAFSTPYTLRWFLFTTGLFLSSVTDLIITLCLCYYLRQIRRLSNSSVMKGVLDTLTLYTLENGFVTCLTTTAALFFWLRFSTSTISLSLHFIIGKMYPNSLLVLLNTRKELREMHSGDQGIHFDPSNHLATYYTQFPHRAPITHCVNRMPTTPPAMYEYRPSFKMHKPVEVKVEQTVRRDRNSAAISDVSSKPAHSFRPGSAMHWPPLP
ncbi:hypothetical protein DFH09DRAFT_1145917 [Mycena vulgaris]|nr:hypothetical protein DFH09DRAFT_1145917 [Mycena vulgaris]